MTTKITPEKIPVSHRHWNTTHTLFLERMREVNALRPADNPMTFLEFMDEVAHGRIKMPMRQTV